MQKIILASANSGKIKEIKEFFKDFEVLAFSEVMPKFEIVEDGESFKEKALRYKNNLRYIDLLVKQKSGVWNVVDYKSSMAYSEHHLKQVRYYVDAIKEITGDEVEGYLYYLLKDQIKIIQV